MEYWEWIYECCPKTGFLIKKALDWGWELLYRCRHQNLAIEVGWVPNYYPAYTVQHGWFIEVGRVYQLYYHLRSIGACGLLIEEVCNCRALSHMNRGVHVKWKNFIHYCILSHMGFQHGQHLSCSPSAKSLLCSSILRVGSNMWGTTLRSNGLYVGGIIIRHMNHLWSPVPGPGWAIITVLNLIFIPLCKTRK